MRNFSGKTRVTPRPRHKAHPALPRVPPRPFRPFPRLANPNDDANVDFLANSVPAGTALIPTTSVSSEGPGRSTELTANSIPSSPTHIAENAAPFFLGDGSFNSPFTEATQGNEQTDHHFQGQENLPLPEIISEHNPFIARAACWEDLRSVADVHGFVLDEHFRLTAKVKDPRPSTELSAICAGDRYNCPHPSYSPDRHTLGPEYCADRLFFDGYYHNDDAGRRKRSGRTTRREMREDRSRLCGGAARHN
jgi:hypothetical protein